MAIKSERVTFEGGSGQLAARLDLPPGKPRAYALFAHCFTCGKDIFAVRRIARHLARRGIAVLRFDFTGLGSSEGEFANANFSSNVEDLLAAARYMRGRDMPAALLIGHSLGGTAALKAAADIAEVKAVATIGAPFDPSHVENAFRGHIREIEDSGVAEVTLAGRSFRIKKQFLEDARAQSIADALDRLDAALLVMQSPIDEYVGIDNATDIFVRARHPKSFLSLDRADHLLTRPEDAAYAAEALAAWAGKYIGLSTPERPATQLNIGETDTYVAESGDGKFTQYIEASGHPLIADEPEPVGGFDWGPSPYDLVLAGLGACTSMTLRMYAAHKKIPLDRVAVRLRHGKQHAKDCEDCPDKNAQIDHIDREIELSGDLDAETKQRLLEIADKCPVHKTLARGAEIETKLSEG